MTAVLVDDLRAAARWAVKAGAAAVDAVRAPDPGVVVLLYHRVGAPGGGQVNLDIAAFTDQMAELAASGRVCSLDAALDRLADPTPVTGPAPVVLTFDDGTADLVEHALPVLVDLGLPATLYLATRWVEQGESFWDDGTTLSWAALADALGTGVLEVGSHSHSHLLFDRTPAVELAADLDRSIDLIGERLGVTARHFAYPKALEPTAAAELEVRARFASAALAGTRPNVPGATDPHRLARSPVQVADGTRWFRRKADGGLAAEDGLRRVLASRRYAGSTR